jgi:uncharacterized protein
VPSIHSTFYGLTFNSHNQLFIHPVKSLLPVEVSRLTITPTGIQHDRSFVLVLEPASLSTKEATHITIKTTSQLCLFQTTVDFNSETMTITHKQSHESVTVPLAPSPSTLNDARAYSVTIFNATADAHDMGSAASDFFTTHLPHFKQTVRLVYIGNHARAIEKGFIPKRAGLLSSLLGPTLHPQQSVQFHDGAPVLITTTASEKDANSRLPPNFAEGDDTIMRFRPNIHVSTPNDTPAYDEDRWKKVTIHPSTTNSNPTPKPITLDLVFNTPRCQSLNVDFETGNYLEPSSGHQLYKLLTKDRRVNAMFPHKPCFGRYAFAEPMGAVVRVGDRVSVDEYEFGR